MRILNDRFHADRNVVRVPDTTDGPARLQNAHQQSRTEPSLILLFVCIMSINHMLSYHISLFSVV